MQLLRGPYKSAAARAAPRSPLLAEPLFEDEDGPFHSQFPDSPRIDRDWLEARLRVLEANQIEIKRDITGLQSDIQTLLTNVKRMLPEEVAAVDGVMLVKQEND